LNGRPQYMVEDHSKHIPELVWLVQPF
jgi:hypothetical protein